MCVPQKGFPVVAVSHLPVMVYITFCLLITSVMMVGTQELRLLWAGSGTFGQKKFFLLEKRASEVWVRCALSAYHPSPYSGS